MIDVQICSTRKQNKSNVGISEGLGREGGDARRGELNLNLRRILTPVDLACSVFASPCAPSSSSWYQNSPPRRAFPHYQTQNFVFIDPLQNYNLQFAMCNLVFCSSMVRVAFVDTRLKCRRNPDFESVLREISKAS